jgi:hypothetical protein
MNRNCHRKPPCSPQLTVLIARLAAGLTGADNATKPGVTQGEIENAAGAMLRARSYVELPGLPAAPSGEAKAFGGSCN